MTIRFFQVLAGTIATFFITLSSGHTAAQSLCRMKKIATLPLQEADNTIYTKALLNHKPLSVMVDTGSEGSLLTPETLIHFTLKTDPQRTTLIIGSDGHPHFAPNALAQYFSLGALHIDNLTFPMGSLPSFPFISPPLLGLVGMNILENYDLDINLPHHVLTLWDVKIGSVMCPQPPNWSHLWLNLTAQRHHGRFMVPFTLDGKKGIALIDSGARAHVISTAFTHQLGITDLQLSQDPGGQTKGLGMKENSYHWHHFHHLQIGTEKWSQPTLTVAPIRDHADMLLGAEWFHSHHIWLSSATEHVFVQSVP